MRIYYFFLILEKALKLLIIRIQPTFLFIFRTKLFLDNRTVSRREHIFIQVRVHIPNCFYTACRCQLLVRAPARVHLSHKTRSIFCYSGREYQELTYLVYPYSSRVPIHTIFTLPTSSTLDLPSKIFQINHFLEIT